MYAYDFDISNEDKYYTLEIHEDINSENHEYFFLNDWEINEDDNYDHNELVKEFDEREKKDNIEEKNRLLKNYKISGKSTKDSEKMSSQQSEEPIIDAILTNYQNPSQENKSQEKIEENELNSSLADKANNPIKKRNIHKFSDEF